jgi:hypothetical protein
VYKHGLNTLENIEGIGGEKCIETLFKDRMKDRRPRWTLNNKKADQSSKKRKGRENGTI